MKNNIIKLAAIIAAAPSIIFAQQKEVDSTTIERNNQPPSSVTSTDGNNANVDTTDAGAQRPIFLKTENISAFGGIDSKIYYDDNPMRSGTVLSNHKDAIWTNTAYLGAGLGQIEITDAVITPYIGFSLTNTQYLAAGLDALDYQSTSAYVMANVQHSNGWSYRAGVSYGSDYNDASKRETYSEFYPSVGAMKTYSHNEDLLGIFNLSVGYHESKSENALNSSREDDLDNFDVIASYGLQYVYQNLIISPTYSAVFKSYSEDSPSHNDGREDLIHSLNLRIDYPVNEFARISLFGGYSKRDTKSSFADYDFVSGTCGLSLGLNTTF